MLHAVLDEVDWDGLLWLEDAKPYLPYFTFFIKGVVYARGFCDASSFLLQSLTGRVPACA